MKLNPETLEDTSEHYFIPAPKELLSVLYYPISIGYYACKPNYILQRSVHKSFLLIVMVISILIYIVVDVLCGVVCAVLGIIPLLALPIGLRGQYSQCVFYDAARYLCDVLLCDDFHTDVGIIHAYREYATMGTIHYCCFPATPCDKCLPRGVSQGDVITRTALRVYHANAAGYRV